jgi:general L-amino acid transport system substrate-binding protein
MKMKMKLLQSVFCAAVLGVMAQSAHAGATLDAVKAKGFVQCGVNTGLAGFALPDKSGNWVGLDVDVCRAVASAVLGDAKKVKFSPLTSQSRFTALQSGEIDMLARNATFTASRDMALGLMGTTPTYYDGEGVMVPKKLGVKSVKDLNGATICVLAGSTTELNLADWFRAHKLQFKPVVIEKLDEIQNAFYSGRCDAFTTDMSGLAASRASSAPNPEDYVILPEVMSKEPLGPMVRQGDDQWYNVVKWSVYAMLEAEEYGITSKNVDEQLKSPSPDIQRILGQIPGFANSIGMNDKWAYNIVKQVGNYKEVFDRNMGDASVIKVPRGVNNLWNNGGIMYAMPIR